ncbi:hypothetical protein EI94DRAFT_1717270 [Lactarius quietus]|nr:hypothetical protein EI94DRAFT_1717270 [Lactarius quietus]
MLLWLYLLDLPEPLFMLSLRDYRHYTENRAKYAENDFSLLRTKIRENSLRHLLRVSSHSHKNVMNVEALAIRFSYTVLRTGNVVLQGGVDVKNLVMEDLIQNAHTLFDERPAPSPPVPSLEKDGVERGGIHARARAKDEQGEKVEHGKT